MEFDPLILSRVQFAANITFHILFPTITIGLGWILFFFKIRYNQSKDDAWMKCYFFFTKIFALTFAIGVVTGVTMSFQFGTNWPGFMEKAGNIAGPLLAYEILTAFFMEATFLGVMLFGFRKVSPFIHNLATFLVAIGTTISAFWILVLNSWMQTPDGFEMRDGIIHAVDWMKIIFNPSMTHRVFHMLLASGLTAAFLVAGISAFRWLKNDRRKEVMFGLKTGVFLAAILIPLQILLGDALGLNTLKHQPQKIAAMEGLWKTKKGAPLVLFAIPDEAGKSNLYAIEIPKAASLILTHDLNGEIKGLNEFADLNSKEGMAETPPVAPVFFAFRIMVGMGFLMLLVAFFAAFILYRKKDLDKYLAYTLVAMTFSGWIATVSGWYVTEIGRQPWLIYKVLKVADTVGPVPGSYVAVTLTSYLITYALLLISYIATIFYLAKKASKQETLT